MIATQFSLCVLCVLQPFFTEKLKPWHVTSFLFFIVLFNFDKYNNSIINISLKKILDLKVILEPKHLNLTELHPFCSSLIRRVKKMKIIC